MISEILGLMKWSLRAYNHIHPIDVGVIVDNYSMTALDTYNPPIVRAALTSLLNNVLNTDFNIEFCVVVNRAFQATSTRQYRIREHRTSLDIANLLFELH